MCLMCLMCLTEITVMTCVGVITNRFGNIPTIAIILVVLGTSAMAVGKSGVILIKSADGSIIKDGAIK